jgi:hypothetical protein
MIQRHFVFLVLSLLLSGLSARFASAGDILPRVIDLTGARVPADTYFRMEGSREAQVILPLTGDLPYFEIVQAQGVFCQLTGLAVLDPGVAADLTFQPADQATGPAGQAGSPDDECVLEISPDQDSPGPVSRVHLQR